MIIASTGLRHGDPLSPFLYTIVMDVFFFRMFSLAERRCLINVLEVGRTDHCFFDYSLTIADDLQRSLTLIICCIKEFEEASGLNIYYQKPILWGLISIILLRNRRLPNGVAKMLVTCCLFGFTFEWQAKF